jgi:uncharacterized protein (DUF3084 family)
MADPEVAHLKELMEAKFDAVIGRLDRFLDSMLQARTMDRESNETAHQGLKALMDAARAEVIRTQQQELTRTEGIRLDLEKRLDEMNQLRRQIEQERALYVDRDRLDQTVKSLDTRLDEMNNRIANTERLRANLDGRFTMLAAVLFGGSVVINLLITYFGHR